MPQTMEEVLTSRRRQDPNYRLPFGYRWDAARNVVVAGPGAMGGLGGVPGAETPTTGISLGGGGETGIPGVTIGSGVPNGMPGSVPLTDLRGGQPGAGAGSGGGGNGIMDWLSNPTNWMSLLGMAGDVGSVLGSASQGAAAGRATEADLLSRRDLAQNQQYGVQQNAEMSAGNLDLNRKQFEENARGSRAKQGMIGNILSNMQDFNISVPGVTATSVGGLRPSALGAGGRANAAELARSATQRQIDPETYHGGSVLPPPPLSSIPKPSGLETAGGTAGTILSLLGALGRRSTVRR